MDDGTLSDDLDNAKVWTITNDASNSNAWNGNGSFTTWGTAHPYAFYEVESKTLSPEALSYYNETTARNGNIADIAFLLQQRYGLVQDGDKYYYSNYPETAPAEHSSYGNLVDGDDNTYFHSSWSASGAATDPKHFLCAEVENPVEDFYIITKRRCDNNNNRPKSIFVAGTNEGSNLEEVAKSGSFEQFAELKGLPTDANEYFYFSDKIKASQAYKYLCFTPEATNTGYRYFTYSEFYIIPSNETTDAVMAAIKGLYDMRNIKDEALTNESIIAAGKALDASSEDIALLEAKDEANALLSANESNHAEDPVLGQYPTTAYNAFQTAVNTATTSEELKEAIKTFKFSINAPVFLINGAFDGAYSTIGKSIYYTADDAANPLHWKDKETNKYDKTMLWKFAGLTSTTPEIGATYSLMNLSADVYLWGVENVTIENTNPANSDGIVLLKTEGYADPIHADQNGKIVRWGNLAAESASAWTLEYVGESKNIEKIADEQLDAYAELQTLIDECEPYEDKIGEGLNHFSASDDFSTVLDAAEEVLNDNSSDVTAINKAIEQLENVEATLEINEPETGKFYRFKSATLGNYISSTTVGKDNRPVMTANPEEAVFYLTADHRLITENLQAMDNYNVVADLGEETTFKASEAVIGNYAIRNNNGTYFAKATGEQMDRHGDENTGLTTDDCAWILEEVTDEAQQPSLSKTLAAESEYYATIAAPVALKIPEGVKAYTVKVEGEVAKLTELSGVIPAGVAAVIKGTEGKDYEFTFAPEGSTTNENDLQGVYVETEIPAETTAYVLAKGNQGVGFYLLDATDRTLAANKAYLVLPAGAENVKAFILNTGDLTGIESVATGAEAEEYYDLQGRRVMKPTKGIYVTKSGKKVIF